MSERTGTCEDCSTTFVAASKGVIPKRCPECHRLYRNRYIQTRMAARPPREKVKRTLICGDCGADFDWTVIRGPLPTRCKPCAKNRRITATRERGRVRRAAAKVGDTRRHTVCIDCFKEFVAPPRGSLPRRCEGCTTAWNKIRHKTTAGRTEGNRRRHLLNKYGMSQADWDFRYVDQEGRCAICRLPEDQVVGGRLHIDHCHDSGKVRGLLCQGCNTGIGKLGEDPAIIKSAAAYVERHRSATLA